MRTFTLLMVLLVTCTCAWAVEGLNVFNVILLQPDFVFKERAPHVELMAAYIRSVESAAQSAIADNDQHLVTSGFIVVAVRPGQRSNVWLDFDPSLPPDLRDNIVAKVKQVLPFEARVGTVVFAIKVGIWGGNELTRASPEPAEWKAAIQKAGHPIEVTELVDLIWGK